MLGPTPDADREPVFSSAGDWRRPSGTSHQSLTASAGGNSSPVRLDRLARRTALPPRRNLLHNVSFLMTSLSFCVDYCARRGSRVVVVVCAVVVVVFVVEVAVV